MSQTSHDLRVRSWQQGHTILRSRHIQFMPSQRLFPFICSFNQSMPLMSSSSDPYLPLICAPPPAFAINRYSSYYQRSSGASFEHPRTQDREQRLQPPLSDFVHDHAVRISCVRNDLNPRNVGFLIKILGLEVPRLNCFLGTGAGGKFRIGEIGYVGEGGRESPCSDCCSLDPGRSCCFRRNGRRDVGDGAC